MQQRQLVQPGYRFNGTPDGVTGQRMRRGSERVVGQWEAGLLFRHGVFVEPVGPGAVRRWKGGYSLRTVDRRPWMFEVPIQEIPSADGIPLKISVTGQARVADALRYVTAARQPEQAIYVAIQIGLRELVAATTYHDLLANRADIGDRLRATIRNIDGTGITLDELNVKDVIVPAELKRAQIQAQVAQAQAAAALERARGETAALRSMANAARMAAENPMLIQLRLLQQLDASSGHTVVIGPTSNGEGSSAGGR